MKKVCAHCKRPKDIGEFTKDSSRKDGRCPYCRLCNRQLANAWSAKNPKKKKASRSRWLKKKGSREKQRRANRNWKANNPEKVKDARLKREYGSSTEEFNAKLTEQGGCAVCKRTVPTSKGWDFDHCHRTGENRGVLCHKCNLLLGLCDESIQILQNAIDYLRSYEDKLRIAVGQ